jgi:hypothetical protein
VVTLYELANALGARQEVRNLIVMAMRPNLLPEEVHLVECLERSARAEVEASPQGAATGRERTPIPATAAIRRELIISGIAASVFTWGSAMGGLPLCKNLK